MTGAMDGARVLVTGGGGYVGARLVPALLAAGHEVRVLDLFIYGQQVFDKVAAHPSLSVIQGDIRDETAVQRALKGIDAVIHLACISNDPSFELNPALGKSINLDAFVPLVETAKSAGVRRFVNASSSSVYGVKNAPAVTEELSLEPLTDYSRFKADCETLLQQRASDEFIAVSLRPATICGYSPRQRLDVIVNILTNHAVNRREITVMGGDQTRPNIHIDDMVEAFLHVLAQPDKAVAGKVYNVGHENHTVGRLAEMVRETVGPSVAISRRESDDPRSYHISSERIARELGFRPRKSISDGISDLAAAFGAGLLPDPLENSRYFNNKRMQELALR
jgi:nucleoside-diphosphate-sugar epimerase